MNTTLTIIRICIYPALAAGAVAAVLAAAFGRRDVGGAARAAAALAGMIAVALYLIHRAWIWREVELLFGVVLVIGLALAGIARMVRTRDHD